MEWEIHLGGDYALEKGHSGKVNRWVVLSSREGRL